jgi:hypothetical protein
MILEEYFSCEVAVMLFVAGIVVASDLMLLWIGVIIYRFREKINQQQLWVLLILLGINMLVITSYGISTIFLLPQSRCA